MRTEKKIKMNKKQRKEIIESIVNCSSPPEQFFGVLKKLQEAVKPRRGRPKKEVFKWKED